MRIQYDACVNTSIAGDDSMKIKSLNQQYSGIEEQITIVKKLPMRGIAEISLNKKPDKSDTLKKGNNY